MAHETDADVIVVGSGAAGACAFLEAATAGVRVLGVEAATGFGGTARLAGGGMCVPGTALQAERGISDSAELALADLAAGGHDFDRDWARVYFERGRTDLIDWLTGLGVGFPDIKHFEGESVPRFHRPLNGGAGLMAVLWERLKERGLQSAWHFGWRFTDLVVAGGKVGGVVCHDAEGRERRLHAPAVVIAIGGFAGSLEMIRRHARRLDDVPLVLAGGGPGARGEAIAILQRHGVRFGYLDELYCYATGVPDYCDPAGERGVVFRGRTGWLWLNRNGERFHDESQSTSGNLAVPRLLAQPEATGWAIFDEAMLPDIAVDDHHVPPGSETGNEAARRHLAHSPWVCRADTLDELFRRAGIDTAGAARTVAQWNGWLTAGLARDPVTGRALTGLPQLASPPFYAVRFVPIGRKAMGGVQTDRDCRVLLETGAVLPGLYAAGEVAGMAGGHIGGIKPLEGMMVGPSCFSGRIAGREAAGFAARSSRVR
jgi:predicted oxidoreductase